MIAGVDSEVKLLDADSAVGKLAGVEGGLSWGGEYTAAVLDAVRVGVGSQVGRINAVKTQVVADRLGVVGATNAYVSADEEMAAQVQAQAALSAGPGDTEPPPPPAVQVQEAAPRRTPAMAREAEPRDLTNGKPGKQNSAPVNTLNMVRVTQATDTATNTATETETETTVLQ